MIEQPLWADDFYFHAMLQQRLDTAICLDESIRNRRDALAAIEMESCRIINIKLGRVGGFSEAIAIHNATQERGIPVWCGGMLESGIGRSHNIALSTLENFSLPGRRLCFQALLGRGHHRARGHRICRRRDPGARILPGAALKCARI